MFWTLTYVLTVAGVTGLLSGAWVEFALRTRGGEIR